MRRLLSFLCAFAIALSLVHNVCFGASDVIFVTETESVGSCDGNLVVVSESSVRPLSIRSSRLDVSGGLFSNTGIEAKKGVKYVTPESCDFYTFNFFQEVFDSARDFEYHTDSLQMGGEDVFVNDYSEKDASISGRIVKCAELIGASEELKISASLTENYVPERAIRMLSLNGDIKINANVVDLYGLIYAPNGVVEINANNVSFRGLIIAKEVHISANSINLAAHKVGFDVEMYIVDSDDIFTGSILDAGSVNESSTSTSGGGTAYYYNTGGRVSTEAKYDRYLLLRCVNNGDIIYEAGGGGGYTGHIAVVHKFITQTIYDYSRGPYVVTQIQLIEAIEQGVCYGLLDDTRCDKKGVTILRSKQLTNSLWSSIRNFLEKQIGKKYSLVLFRRNTSEDSSSWYCSELVWAAYKSVGIDLEKTGSSEPGVTPHDINENTSLTRINYKPKGHHNY
ncbi:MAG: hypothetical protein J5645_02505 [Lachnospiraceae bacterium]|nr:hypothetical protein [Lachnospiraceae bacterium]